uniref:Uncharacterized protein n=1 Tax=Bos indicus x Bos taurus TaxID=30522 RepID=A0A4W2EAI7_BOBOX
VCVFWGVGWVLAGVGLLGVWEGLGERWRMKSPAPFLNSRPHKPGREGAYSRCRVSCRCAKMGVGGGEGAWQSSPQGGSLKAIQFLLPGGRQDRGEGWVGDLGVPCVQLCIFRGVLRLVPAVGVSVCVNLPFPVPCMTCDAADTTILCAGVCWGHRGARPMSCCARRPVTHVLGCRK